ncbi:MAG: hypothetical protein ACP5O3_03165 [Candidatus Micrarchaeia archaeon]|jgi:hypothetical protein
MAIKTVYVVGAVVVIAFAALAVFSLPSTQVNAGALANCLSEKGWAMYGTQWCTACNAQKKLFGDAFENISLVDCDFDRPACDAFDVRGYPTWFNGAKKLEGVQSLETLAAESGC